ncbi:MAG TPA: DUF5916 domain-containing protein [Thermoanaerobaculia bacterium]|nr:DUF5916 domain-containing protein [Thermoanaerobaculia bacterium]
MRLVTRTSPKVDRRRALLLGAVLALALPWALHAQAAGEPTGQPPAAPPATPPPATVPPAAPPTPDTAYVARPVRFATPPVIDGKLDDPIWKTAARLDGFRQLEPHEGEPALETTEVFLGFDNDSLYIGVRCHDSEPKGIVTTSLTRDADITYDDTLQILIDTYHDGRSGYVFATNSGGVQVDGLVRNEGEQVNLDWDGIWTVVAKRDAAGWTAEFAIPWRTLSFPDRPEQIWGFNVERWAAHKRERSFWKPVGHSWYARYKLSEAGTLVGIEGAKPGSRFHFIPYAIGGAEQPPGGGSTSSVTHLGGDVKANLTSDLVADLTIKTDFSETEADEQDVNLTRNALLFPEKRAFFLEGSSLFYFGERPDPEHPAEYFLFHSRSIGLTPDGRATIPLLGGLKLSGHQGNYDVGVLGLETEATHKSDGYGGVVDEPRTTYSVLRLKRDFAGGSSFGVIGLSKDATDDRNRVGGADWDVTLNQYLRTGGFVTKSSTPGLNGDDVAAHTDLYWDSRNARLHYEYTDIGQNFNDELGFFTRTGVRHFRTDNYWILWPEGGIWKQGWFVYDLDYITDRTTGELQTRINHLKYSGYFRDGSGVAYKYYDELEVLTTPFEIKHGIFIPPGSYRFTHHFFGFQTDYTKPLAGVGRVAWGQYFDGHFTQVLYYLTYRPIPGLYTAVTYQDTRVHLKEGSFTNDIFLGEITYAFTPQLATRLWVQQERNANLREKFDVNWEFRPGSKLYVIYENIKSYVNFFDSQQPLFGTPGRSLLTKVVFFY